MKKSPQETNVAQDASTGLKELIKTDFTQGVFPSDWMIARPYHTFKDGRLLSGRGTQATFMLPGRGWNHLKVDILAQRSLALYPA